MTNSGSLRTSLNSQQWHAVSASFLGWTLHAFDFFVAIFLVNVLAAQFHVPASKIIFTTAATLAMRPVGALIFGFLADRYGRRTALMANVVFFFGGGVAVRVLAELHRISCAAHDLRDRHGRRVGRGVVAGDGKCSAEVERHNLRHRAVGYSCGYLLAAVAVKS